VYVSTTTLLHNVIAWATCFDYLSVIFRPIFVNWFTRFYAHSGIPRWELNWF